MGALKPALTLRVYLDTSSLPGGGGYYPPLHPGRGCATLLPVPEPGLRGRPPPLDPWVAGDPCTGRAVAWFQPLGLEWPLHRDPRLDLGWYMDRWAPRGRLPRRLAGGGLLLFVAGLAVYPEGFWAERRSLSEIRRAFRGAVEAGRAGVYLVGLLEAWEALDVGREGWGRLLARCPTGAESPHYWTRDHWTVALLGRGFLVEPPLYMGRPGSASEAARQLLGGEAAEALARGRFRRSRLLALSLDALESLVSGWGSRLVEAGVCTPG